MSEPDSPAGAADLTLDLRGLNCPLPVLKTAKAMKPLPAGARIDIAASDPLASLDIPNFCREQGHELVAAWKDGEVLHFTLRKGGS